MKKKWHPDSGSVLRKANTFSWFRLMLCIAAIWITSCTTLKNIHDVVLADQTAHVIDSICMETLVEEKFPGMAIAVLQGDRLWANGYGYADLGLKKAVSPSDHLFRIGNVSKTVTASALGRLIDKGEVKLDVPISGYFKASPVDKKNITLRQLGGHQAGIRHYHGAEFLSNIHYQNVRDALEVFIHEDLLFTPGTKYSYTTYGWTLISAVMEDAAAKPFLEIIDDEVRKPLRLTDLKADHIDSIHFNRVQFYELVDGNQVVSPVVDNSNKWAGGGFLCSARELAIYGIAHVTPGYLRKNTLMQLTTSQSLLNGENTNYGIGFRTGTDSKGRIWYGHSGGSVGGTSMLLIYPEEKLVIVTLVNLSGADMNDLAWKIADIIRNLPAKN